MPEQAMISIMSLDTVASTALTSELEPDDTRVFYEEIFSRAKSVVEQNGGTFLTFDGDGGIAIFGWPMSAENHADLACKAASTIQNMTIALDEFVPNQTGNVIFRIAVHSGLVAFRRIQLTFGSHLDVVGQPVNLVAKLQKAADPGTTLITQTCLDLCRGDVKTNIDVPAEAVSHSPEKLWRLESIRTRQMGNVEFNSDSKPLIGRGAILGRAQAWKKAGPEQPYLLAIGGESGIGKTFLAETIIRNWISDGQGQAKVFSFFGEEQFRSTPFRLLRRFLDELCSSVEFDEGAKAKVGELLSLVGKKWGLGPHQPAGQDNLFELVTELIANISEKHPLVLFFDDWQWMDLESCDFISKLAHDGPPGIRLIVTTRPDRYDSIAKVATDCELLERLNKTEARELAKSLLPEIEYSTKYLEAITAKSEGLPLAVTQLLASYNEQSNTGMDRVPSGIQSIIHSRINRLEQDTKLFVQTISIIGDEAEVELIQEVGACSNEGLPGHIRSCEKADLVKQLPDGTLKFAHSLVAAAARTTIPKRQRRKLHAGVFSAIKKLYGDHPAQLSRLAHHARNANDHTTALEYYWRAGQQARRNSASASMSIIFDDALECIDHIGKPAEQRYVDFVLLLGAMLIQRGEVGTIKTHLERVLKILEPQDEEQKLCSALSQSAMIIWFDGEYARGKKLAAQNLEIATRLGHLPSIFASRLMYACNSFFLGENDIAISETSELINLLKGELEIQRLGAAGIASAMARAFHGWFLSENGQLEEGLRQAQKGLEISQTNDDVYGSILALNSIGWNALFSQNYPLAVETLERALRLADKNGYDAIKPHIIGRLAMACARSGQAERGASQAAICAKSDLMVRTGKLETFYLYAGYGEALAGTGDLEKSKEALDTAMKLARLVRSPPLLSLISDIRERAALA